MKKQYFFRGIYYVIGLLLLALGLVMNAKACLGVTPIMSLAYCVSELTGINLGNVTLLWYSIFVVIQMILHIRKKSKMTIVTDLLQLPLSLVFTRFINMFSAMIPACSGKFGENMGMKVSVLTLAIILTGLGAALSLNAKLIPNPGDGIVKAIADTLGKRVGITKNFVDTACVLITIIVSFTFGHTLIGIGIGTICAMICVGRVIEFFHRFIWRKMRTSAGL